MAKIGFYICLGAFPCLALYSCYIGLLSLYNVAQKSDRNKGKAYPKSKGIFYGVLDPF